MGTTVEQEGKETMQLGKFHQRERAKHDKGEEELRIDRYSSGRSSGDAPVKIY